MTNACEACGHVKRIFFFCPACGGRFEVRSETSQRVFCSSSCAQSPGVRVPDACVSSTMFRSRDGDATGLAPGVAAQVSLAAVRGGGQEPGGDA